MYLFILRWKKKNFLIFQIEFQKLYMHFDQEIMGLNNEQYISSSGMNPLNWML